MPGLREHPGRGKEIARIVGASLGLLVTGGLASAVATLLLAPLWRWVEATLGIEAIGHSGPAAWCYFAVFAVFLAGLSVAAYFHLRRHDAS